jgi:hypothetical protein
MSQWSAQTRKGFTSDVSCPAFTCACKSATSTAYTVRPWNTVTANVIGVFTNNCSTGGVVEVAMDGTAKVLCAASVSAGALVGPNTVTANLSGGIGQIIEKPTWASATGAHIIGVALEPGSTNTVIEVMLQVFNLPPVA